MPLPNTRVIHPDWAARHRPTATGTMTATIAWRHPDQTQTGFDDETGRPTFGPSDAYFEGPARVQAMSTNAQQTLVAEQDITQQAYLVSVEWDAATDVGTGFRADDIGDVVAVDDNGNPTLVGKALTVRSVIEGSLAFQRDLICLVG